jgi:hypothetical protein
MRHECQPANTGATNAGVNVQLEVDRLGLDIALAMVLATQSEDPKLEAYAYQCFKRFLWQPGEGPIEFQEYQAAA